MSDQQFKVEDFMTPEQLASFRAGDCLVDCTDAVQRAFDAAHAKLQGAPAFPLGTLTISDPIVLK